jgi:uncharacterized membrane protein
MGGSPIYRAYYWPAKGDGSALPNPSTVESWRVSRAFSINKTGEIAGEAFSGPWMPRAVYWSAKHEATDIHTDLVAAEKDIVTSRAYEMTDDGTVAGIAWNAAWNGTITETWAWTWTVEDGVEFVSRGLTDHGLIWQGAGKYLVGAIGDEVLRNPNPTDAEAALWTWSESKGIWELEILPALSGYGSMMAFDANTPGDLVGAAYDEDGYMHAWAAVKKDKK